MRKGDDMITIHSLDVDGIIFTGIQLELSSTTMFIVTNEKGYIMSAPFSVQFAHDQRNQRQPIAGIVTNVRSIDDLLTAPLEEITDSARQAGWTIGMQGKDALLKIA